MTKSSVIILLCALLCACSSNVPTGSRTQQTGREIFYSDSLNARDLYRTYPEPKDVVYTPAPKGYRPVYISSYARHGSRRLAGTWQTGNVLAVLGSADKAGSLTPLGREVCDKMALIEEDVRSADGELTLKGAAQHRGIAERMYRNYPHVFKGRGTPVRLYSTSMQRTMMSMFAENERLIELNPKIVSTRSASSGLKYLVRDPEFTKDRPLKNATTEFLREYFDAGPVLGRLFSGDVPALKDTAAFIRDLYNCASITCGLDLEDVDFLWDVFTQNELFVVQQACNYNWYVNNSNSPHMGDFAVPGMRPLLRDFVDRADAALERKVPGADLRFGHDSFLTPFCALIGVDGEVPRETDPLKVIDSFQTFRVAPMAGNVQMVFYRNRSGDVLMKILHNEVETSLPLETDIWPYYRWDDVRAYFISLLD